MQAVGGPKLAPHLSPNKTWGGVPGNILGAGLALALVAFALPRLSLWQLYLLALAIGLGSAWGDLLESLLKRQRRVKDAGHLLPGFGGLLARHPQSRAARPSAGMPDGSNPPRELLLVQVIPFHHVLPTRWR